MSRWWPGRGGAGKRGRKETARSERASVLFDTVRATLDRSQEAPNGSRRAIITGGANHSSGYLNMFKNLRSQSGEDIKIFSTVEDAHRWLGVE